MFEFHSDLKYCIFLVRKKYSLKQTTVLYIILFLFLKLKTISSKWVVESLGLLICFWWWYKALNEQVAVVLPCTPAKQQKGCLSPCYMIMEPTYPYTLLLIIQKSTQKVMLNVSTVWKNWEKRQKFYITNTWIAENEAHAKVTVLNYCRCSLGFGSLYSLICLHLFRLSAKDRLLSPTRLQRLTNPKKKLSLEFALNGLSVCGLHRNPHIWGVFDFVLSAVWFSFILI